MLWVSNYCAEDVQKLQISFNTGSHLRSRKNVPRQIVLRQNVLLRIFAMSHYFNFIISPQELITKSSRPMAFYEVLFCFSAVKSSSEWKQNKKRFVFLLVHPALLFQKLSQPCPTNTLVKYVVFRFAGPCRDANPDCQAWADRGMCTQHATYMSLNCAKTCGACSK